jgi:hypothetical protein
MAGVVVNRQGFGESEKPRWLVVDQTAICFAEDEKQDTKLMLKKSRACRSI